MLNTERRMEALGTFLAKAGGHRVTEAAALEAARAAERDGLTLGAEQAAALLHVTGGTDLALVVGFAGTGKSSMLGVARHAWEAAGYRVLGAALSGIAAEGLEAGSGVGSRTLASLEYGWTAGRDRLTRQDVLVVDEAGMIGSEQMERVLRAAERAGCKVVLVGDPEQLQAIEAGAAFRALAERHGARAITAVRRQRKGWQRAATRELATGRTEEALGRYAEAGMVQAAGTRAEAKAALVAGWDAVREQAPQASQVILAYTRDDVRDLNELARERMRAAGALRGTDQVVATERGARSFAAGDRIMFGRNERGLGGRPGRGQGVAVKNGSLGTVLAVEAGGERLTVQLDGAGGAGGAGQAGTDARPVATFYVRDYGHVDHGYAATVHKAQGVTVDQAHVLATPHLDRHAAYVGLTRHRDGIVLHYGRDDFADGARLARRLSREQAKDTTLDYDPKMDLMRRYAERRGLDPLRPAPDLTQTAAAGRAGFRERFAAHQRQQEHARAQARDEAAARELVETWIRLARAYHAALPTLETDPRLGETRLPLLQFARALPDKAGAVRVLREHGEAFGMTEQPALSQVVAHEDPAKAMLDLLGKAETATRAQLKQAAEREAARQAAERDAARQQEELRARQAPRPSRGMSPGW